MTDIDECNNASLCSDNWSQCVNTLGSYICVSITIRLRSFFQSADGGKSCEQDNGGCSQLCSEVTGGYECSCNPGYQLDDSGHICVDIDECTENWPCSQTCENTDGSFICSCHHGFTLDEDGQNCLANKSCTDGTNGGCDHVCHQLYGSRICDCYQGYTLSTDFTSCDDINECLAYNPCSQACNNTMGGYECSCFNGYRENGTNICIDINECEENRSLCDTSSACLNSPGSFSCVSLIMDVNMEDDPDMDGDGLLGDLGGANPVPPVETLNLGPQSESMSSSTQLIVIVCVLGGVVLLLIVAAALGFMMLFKRMDDQRSMKDPAYNRRSGDVESLPRGGSCVGEQRSYTFNP